MRYKGLNAVGIAIYQLPGANALDVARDCKAELKKLTRNLPPGMKCEIAFDTTLAVDESIHEVIKTLAEAIFLVVLVIFFFLQSWRTTLIPAITIPVSLIGTFAAMKVMDFSINTLTLFGITLATGLVVDDAIVVIENIARLMEERGLSPVDAAREGMKEVTGAVIATTLVLAAVFVPVAFFPGTTGQLYRQFALTLAISVAISAFNALTLTPALAALLLKHEKVSNNWIFVKVNQILDGVRTIFDGILNILLRYKPAVVVAFLGSLALTAFLYTKLPTGFLPDEDVGYFMIIVQGPEGVSLDYTSNVVAKVEKIVSKVPELQGVFAVGGFGFNGNSSSSAIVFCTLKPWDERKKEINRPTL